MGLQTSAVFPDVGEEFPQTMTGPPRHTAARAQQLVVGGQPVRPQKCHEKKSHILCRWAPTRRTKKRVVITSN